MSSKKKRYLKGCGITAAVITSLCCILLGAAFIAVLLEDPYEKTLALYENQEYAEANEEIDALIIKDSINPSLRFLKGKIAFELHDTIASQKNINLAITYTDNTALKFKRSKAVFDWRLQKKDTLKATSILMESLPLFKRNDYKRYIQVHYQVADAFDKVEMSDKSIVVLNNLIDSISIKYIDTVSYKNTHYTIYDKLLRLRDTISALRALEKVVKEIEESKIAYEKLGNFYRKKSQHKKAIFYYINYLKIDTTNVIVYTSLGKCYRDIKYKKSAKRYFEIGTRKGSSEACSELRELTAKTRYSKESICCDGSRSYSTGRGTCSHHGGVCRVEYVPYKVYTMSCRN